LGLDGGVLFLGFESLIWSFREGREGRKGI